MTASESLFDQTGLAVAVGRIEESAKNTQEAVTRIEASVNGLASTVARHDTDIALLKERQPKHTPWYFTVGAVVGLVTVAILLISTIVTLTRIAQALQ